VISAASSSDEARSNFWWRSEKCEPNLAFFHLVHVLGSHSKFILKNGKFLDLSDEFLRARLKFSVLNVWTICSPRKGLRSRGTRMRQYYREPRLKRYGLPIVSSLVMPDCDLELRRREFSVLFQFFRSLASPARGDDKPALQPIEKTKKKIRQNQRKKAL
jgi:hypothetical protein